LYTGNSHYDSLIVVVNVISENNCSFDGRDNNGQHFLENCGIQGDQSLCFDERESYENFEKGKDVFIVTNDNKTTTANKRNRLARSSYSERIVEPPVLKRKRSLGNEKRREARNSKIESPEKERKRSLDNEKRRQARNHIAESPEMERKTLSNNENWREARKNVVESP
jgi:hypothetical protein